VGSSSVVVGECAWWAAEGGVDKHGEDEREASWDDALRETGKVLATWCSRRMWRLRVENTDSTTRRSGLGGLARRALPGLLLIGSDGLHADELEAVVIFSSAVAGIGEQNRSGVGAGESWRRPRARSHRQSAGHSRPARRPGR
jgi:hypothetical protein